MNDQQLPAIKPLYHRDLATSTAATRSSPALRGATSAFFPKPTAPTVGLSPTSTSPPSAGARYAALAAGARSRQTLPNTLAQEHNVVQKEVSPERGRSAQPVRTLMTKASSSVASSDAKFEQARPVPLERSPSTIAARFASSQSSSPRKSPARSPERISNHNTVHASPERYNSDLADALSGALASLAASKDDTTQTPLPVRSRALNFERIPQLPAPITQVQPAYQVSKHNAGSVNQVNSPAEASQHAAHSLPVRDRTQSLNSMLPARQLTRAMSDFADAKTASDHSDKSKPQASGKGRPAVPTRLSHRDHRISPPPHGNTSAKEQRIMVNNLADAMVASSLASSRAASPAKRPLVLASRRRSRSFSALQDLVASYDVDQSAKHVRPTKPKRPQRPMKQTLRKPSASDDEEEPELVKRGRRHWMRKHPNMHHEGNRKRWRDTITELERRRYEGVFAANRGLHIGPGYFEPSPSALSDLTAEGNKVANVVVRDIWDRSRLPREILREIYDLVSPEEEQSLGRDQFVVGMWLVDQRLKGRKLPVKVSATVWASARHAAGIKLRRGK